VRDDLHSHVSCSSLENNRIGDDGVIALAMFLVVNKSITTIKYIASNFFTTFPISFSSG
jgi:hypothetical protein